MMTLEHERPIVNLEDDTAVAAGAVFPVIPGNGGHPLDEAPLPYWLDRPCPPWCLISTPHEDREACEDRLHQSASREISLTVQPPAVFEVNGRVIATSQARVVVGMWQHVKDRDPHITLIVNDTTETSFTLAEAAALARLLTAAPSGEYATITLTLEDPETALAPKPWPAAGPPRPFSRPAVYAVLRDYTSRTVLFCHGQFVTLTDGEAKELAAALLELLAAAR
jgi:hypothetical protein